MRDSNDVTRWVTVTRTITVLLVGYHCCKQGKGPLVFPASLTPPSVLLVMNLVGTFSGSRSGPSEHPTT